MLVKYPSKEKIDRFISLSIKTRSSYAVQASIRPEDVRTWETPSEINERTMIDFQSRLGLRRNQALSAIKGSTGRNKKEVAFHECGS